ncbi:MAG: Xaa-Pro peptidase family protein [bacterium]|nr:Xaa-Pro peptidase family protein [bacterium]
MARSEPNVPAPPYAARRRRLVAALRTARVPALLVSNPANVTYLTGFESSNAFLLCTPTAAALITDFRYETAARTLAADQQLELLIAKDGLGRAVATFCRQHHIRTLAFEDDHLTVARYETLRRHVPNVRWRPARPWIMAARLVKDEGELATMRLAVRIAEQAFATIRDHEWIGLTEREAADLLEERLRAAARKWGAHAEPAFPFIVATGPNAAIPHHRPGATLIREGQILLVDWGARVTGYCSDMTRTLFLGTPDAQFKKVYSIVLKAQLAAIRTLKPGVTLKHVDAAARSIIAAAGHAAHFGHATGHRIGLEVHEGLKLAKNNPERARAGMITTIEPGIYLPGWGGVRIEDMVLVTPRGHEVLTALPK